MFVVLHKTNTIDWLIKYNKPLLVEGFAFIQRCHHCLWKALHSYRNITIGCGRLCIHTEMSPLVVEGFAFIQRCHHWLWEALHSYTDVTIACRRLQNLELCSECKAYEQEGILIRINILWHKTWVFAASLKWSLKFCCLRRQGRNTADLCQPCSPMEQKIWFCCIYCLCQ